MTVNISTVQWG